MIIDALTHIHPDLKSFGSQYDLSPEFLIRNLEESPVDRAIVTAIEGENNYCTPTTYIIDACEKYPDHLIGFASVNPITNPNAVADFEKYVTEYGMRGLKLHPRHQQLSADDERIVPVVEKAAELGVPVTICGSLWKHAPLRDQQPINIDVLAKRVPEAKIIIAHSGGFKFMDAFIVAVANDNVFLETSISLKYFEDTPFEDQYMFTLKQIGAHRVIFGSDHPEDPVASCYARSVEMLGRHGFGGDAETQIFGDTIQSLIGL
ncbi:MAG: amidohydrolase family protein [Candidatus Hydrogenedentota bacterium]